MKAPILPVGIHRRLTRGACHLQAPLLLLVRLCWGWEFFVTGKGKLLNLDRTADYFASLGLPWPTLNAVAAATTECAGGLLLMAGLLSRMAALPLTFTMMMAYVTADREALVQLLGGDPEPFLKADPFPFLFAALLILAFGPGKIALDTLIAKRVLPDREAGNNAGAEG